MTKRQTVELIDDIRACFPSWNPKVALTELIETWHDCLGEYDFAAIKDMLKKYIKDDESGYAPAISQLIPKHRNGFTGRTYTHEDFLEMERAALKEFMDE